MTVYKTDTLAMGQESPSLKFPHLDRNIANALRLARTARREQARQKTFVEHRAGQFLDQLEIFRWEWLCAKERLEEIDFGISKLTQRSHNHQTASKGHVDARYQYNSAPTHANVWPKLVSQSNAVANLDGQSWKSGVRKYIFSSLH
jgi:hypothetical protein